MSSISSYDELRKMLKQSADDNYREFTMKICSTKHEVLGVRVPQIRKIVKQIPLEKIGEFIRISPRTYEEVLLRGFLIARLSYENMIKEFDSQVTYIDDWSTCDLFCSAISKLVLKNKEDFLRKKVGGLLDDEREFRTRVGLVLLKCCYVEPDYLNYVFSEVDRLSCRNEYYVKMGLAWLVSECFIKFPTATMAYLAESKMLAWTFNKTISKMCDSYRVDEKTKSFLKKMRK